MRDDLARAAAYAESFGSSDPVMDAGRTLAQEYHTVPAPRTVVSLLELLAGAEGVRHAVEVGTGVGVSALAILRGMVQTGILTSIDLDSDRQAAARDLITLGRIKSHRFRTITGRGEDRLSRLAPASYDLVFLDTDPLALPATLEQAIPLLSQRGVLVIHQALLRGAVANPSDRDPRTQAVRAALKRVRGEEILQPVLLPVGEGLLVARRRGSLL